MEFFVALGEYILAHCYFINFKIYKNFVIKIKKYNYLFKLLGACEWYFE